MNMACKTALGRLDLSELLRRESEAAAETAETDSCKTKAALHASEAALRAAEAALRALDSLRKSSERSKFPHCSFAGLIPVSFQFEHASSSRLAVSPLCRE